MEAKTKKRTREEQRAELKRQSELAYAMQGQGKSHREISTALNVPVSRIQALVKEAWLSRV